MMKNGGHFVWYELKTTDAAAATAFYAAVLGWTSADAGAADVAYTILSTESGPVGGLVAMPPFLLETGMRPGWIGYLGVDGVDAMTGRVEAAGGGIHHAADDIPGVGRYAVVHDPQGADFILFSPTDITPPPGARQNGQVGWHELHAADREEAWQFYAALFGWVKTEAIDMGPAGLYQTFATGAAEGAAMDGGMMTRMNPDQPPAWLYYFNVDDIGAAAARVREAEGQVLNGPMQVPGGMWVAQCLDPQGAMFAMVAPG